MTAGAVGDGLTTRVRRAGCAAAVVGSAVASDAEEKAGRMPALGNNEGAGETPALQGREGTGTIPLFKAARVSNRQPHRAIGSKHPITGCKTPMTPLHLWAGGIVTDGAVGPR